MSVEGPHKNTPPAAPSEQFKRSLEVERPSLEAIRAAWKVEHLELNGKQIELIGVAHHPDTLQVPEFREKLKSAIEHSSLVVLETAPTTFRKYSFAEIKSVVQKLNDELSDPEIELVLHSLTRDNPYGKFYEKLQEMAATFQKPIATVDPKEDILKSFSLENTSNTILGAKLAALFLGLMSGGGVLVSEILNQFPNSPKNAEKPTVSRRSFMKVMGGTAVTLAGTSALTLGADIEEPQKDREENILGTVLYSLRDYRDVAVAEALESLSKKNTGAGPIEVVYGGNHIAGIKHYAEHPTERKAKLLAYKAFPGNPNDSIKIFNFNGEWEKSYPLSTPPS